MHVLDFFVNGFVATTYSGSVFDALWICLSTELVEICDQLASTALDPSLYLALGSGQGRASYACH